MPIRVLSPKVASQIAAGEVIERPASVVKELLENAIDAGATSIHVEVRQGGRRLMSVADNGCGIPAAEVELAFARHATSKLQDVTDLEHITTLGFRGEALASIASVSQVTLLTRATGEELGSRLRIEGAQVVRSERSGHPQGTTVRVENLFYNVPARLKFLRRDATERKHIDALVTRYAMAYPGLRFVLENDGRLTFRSPGSGALLDVLIEVYGLEVAQDMIAVAVGKRVRSAFRADRSRVSRLCQPAGAAPRHARADHALCQRALGARSRTDVCRRAGLPHLAARQAPPAGRAQRHAAPGRGGRQRAPHQERGQVSPPRRRLSRRAAHRARGAARPGDDSRRRPSGRHVVDGHHRGRQAPGLDRAARGAWAARPSTRCSSRATRPAIAALAGRREPALVSRNAPRPTASCPRCACWASWPSVTLLPRGRRGCT